MSFPLGKKSLDLLLIARQMFGVALRRVDAAQAVQRAVRIEDEQLFAAENQFDLREIKNIYSVALGKAAAKMAGALTESLGARLTGGVVAAPNFPNALPDVWRKFVGGHPVPNEQSLAAANAAFELLERANDENSLVIFLVSGGGSAMLELPVDSQISLADLQNANRVLVNCGATIGEINAVRRRVSRVKGGGLSRPAGNAKQITLIISDTNDGEAFNVASGPTIESADDLSAAEIAEVVSRYDLKKTLPRAVIECLEKSFVELPVSNPKSEIQSWKVLLENADAVKAVERRLRAAGFALETATDLVETSIESGCRELAEKLINLRMRTPSEQPAAIVSGGEFVCPVRGGGTGGRNTESALRTAILFDEFKNRNEFSDTSFAALFGGTDGIDGNSPAAGAICDETTVGRAEKMNLNAHEFLENSDSYTFFARLGGEIETGATGTNVRDVRILLAS